MKEACIGFAIEIDVANFVKLFEVLGNLKYVDRSINLIFSLDIPNVGKYLTNKPKLLESFDELNSDDCYLIITYDGKNCYMAPQEISECLLDEVFNKIERIPKIWIDKCTLFHMTYNLKLQPNKLSNASIKKHSVLHFKKLLHRHYPSQIKSETRDISLIRSKNKTVYKIDKDIIQETLSQPILKEEILSIKTWKHPHSNKSIVEEGIDSFFKVKTDLVSKSFQPLDGERILSKNKVIGIKEVKPENVANLHSRTIKQGQASFSDHEHVSSQTIREISQRYLKKNSAFPRQKWQLIDRDSEKKYMKRKSRNTSKKILETFKRNVSLRHDDEMEFFQVIIAYPFHRSKTASKKKTQQRSRNIPIPLSDEARPETYTISNVICPTISVFGTSYVSFPTTSISLGVASESVQKSRLLGNDPSVRKYGRRDPPYRHQRYKEVTARRATFEGWPSYTQQDPELLAKNGFYFTGSDDLVRCFCCGIGLKDWSPEDTPHMEHIRHSPNCTFLIDYLGPEMLAVHTQTMHPNGVPEDIEGGDTVRRYQVRNLEYKTKEAREASFKHSNWPSSVPLSVSQLVEAGLFYTGQGDLCRCFACDGGLQKWEPDDDPWLEHSRWFPSCGFVREVKGDEFVDMVQFVNRSSDQGPTGVAEDDTIGRHVPSNNNTAVCQGQDIEKTVLELGYTREAVRQAIRDLAARGQTNPAANDIVDLIIANQEGEETAAAAPPNTYDFEYRERERLQKFLKCSQCEDRNACMLFMPCAHLNLCEECTTGLTNCPVCQQSIEEKIKTYLS